MNINAFFFNSFFIKLILNLIKNFKKFKERIKFKFKFTIRNALFKQKKLKTYQSEIAFILQISFNKHQIVTKVLI